MGCWLVQLSDGQQALITDEDWIPRDLESYRLLQMRNRRYQQRLQQISTNIFGEWSDFLGPESEVSP
ncbi:MAG: hypothetical protein M0Z65_13095 [Firmicutes bacterium]|uniref:Uncharacterized protein n=1 Tax=Melghirimyces thermohalophilus TaxID=1236220 RepID=A0A1G6MKG5_9BACL|nr:hypothetical protein [Melghirimyces thermohalophilus]MDA8354083.1 hypothetical protein [Bacillota bacterium]SDC55970.1 hypothetical protein SAMN04488112_11026 [Melghirimyces thermohalophilus]